MISDIERIPAPVGLTVARSNPVPLLCEQPDGFIHQVYKTLPGDFSKVFREIVIRLVEWMMTKAGQQFCPFGFLVMSISAVCYSDVGVDQVPG